ncbi:MAG: trypsin-like peptidase domain-containing protein [Firmicutes bacterium]|nr:trypsin-like peptidase domain-containing protein [Bacillota bacterium]
MFNRKKDQTETSEYEPFFTTDEPIAESAEEASWNNYEDNRKKKPHRVAFTRRSVAVLVICCVLLSSLFGFGGAMAYDHFLGNGITTSSTPAATATPAGSTSGYTLESATGSNMTIQEITKKAKSSVVEIKTEGVMSDSWMQQYVTEGAGSGVIISEDGYIMTNNHVIEGAGKITVTTADKKSYEAKLVGTDNINDVAVIKIDASGLTPATYGNSDELAVGDLAVAIGNPLGELGGTVTAGIISATDRQISIDGKNMSLLQTDSSINPGNSGGGLFNGDGQLIGLVVAKSSGSDVEGLGFAIPINTAADVAQKIINGDYVTEDRPWTGMTYTEGSSGFDFFFGSSTSSVYIYSVDTDTAKKAGFEAGDLVAEVDGQSIETIDDLTSVISSHKVGDKLTFKVVRNNQELSIDIELQKKPN